MAILVKRSEISSAVPLILFSAFILAFGGPIWGIEFLRTDHIEGVGQMGGGGGAGGTQFEAGGVGGALGGGTCLDGFVGQTGGGGGIYIFYWKKPCDNWF